MSIVIRTFRSTTLTIDTSSVPGLVALEQMGQAKPVKTLEPGVHSIPVEAGLFRVLSGSKKLKATANTADTKILAVTKDGGSPDPPKITINLDAALNTELVHSLIGELNTEPARSFITAAMSAPAPV